jgi:hypothetical protein
MPMRSCSVTTVRILPVLLTWVALALHGQEALSTAFSYQGQLKLEGAPVNGACDFRFRLWDAETDGLQVGPTQTAPALPVAGGLFALALDFGGVFAGQQLWLETEVAHPAGTGAWVTLAPRQALLTAPQALFALGAPWSGLSSRPALLGSLDGVSNDGGNVDLVAGPNVTIEPDPTGKRITISATGTTYAAGAGLALAGTVFSADFTAVAHAVHAHAAAELSSGVLDDARLPAAIARDAEVVGLVLAADGAGSGLDADLLDGQHAAAFAVAAHLHDERYYTETELSAGGGGGQVHWTNLVSVPAGLVDGSAFDARFLNEGQAGAIGNAMLAADAVTGDKIADAAIGLADLGRNGASDGQILKWNDAANAWVLAADEHGAAGTTYSAGAGLALAGTVFSADFGAVAHAAHAHAAADLSTGVFDDARIPAAVARDAEVLGLVLAADGSGSGVDADLLDGVHAGAFVTPALLSDGNPATAPVGWTDLQGVPAGFADGLDNDALAGLAAAAGQVAKWNGAAWAPAADNDTTYSAGAGLTLTGTVLSADFGALAHAVHAHVATDLSSGVLDDARIPGAIARDVEIMPTVLAGDGASSGLDADLLDGAHASAFVTPALLIDGNPATAPVGWADLQGLPAGFGDGIDNDALAGLAAAAGQVAKWNGTAWAAAADNDAGGDITGVTAGSGLSGGGESGSATLHVGAGTGISVTADTVALAAAYADGSAFDARFVNESQADAITVAMIAPEVLSSLDGVTNDGGNLDLVAGAGITITPDDAGNTITIAVTPVPGSGWSLTGNSGTDPTTQFLGTTDNQPLELRVNGARVLRIEGNAGSTNGPNWIGGYSGNSVVADVVGAVVAGGGVYHGTPVPNQVADDFGVVGGGMGNLAGDPGTALSRFATVAGGSGNEATGIGATVGGGGGNKAAGSRATVPGGLLNEATGDYSFAAGRRAKATQPGQFVWADSSDTDFAPGDADSFNIRAANGVWVLAANSMSAVQFTNLGTGNGITVAAQTSAGLSQAAVYVYNDGNSPAIHAESTGGPAAYLDGNVTVTGTLSAASLVAERTASDFAATVTNNGSGDGIRAYAHASSGLAYAAVYAINGGTSPALYASSTGGLAAHLAGNVTVTSNLQVNGTLTKGAGSFKIDHPLDPANKTLSHSFVESPDMMNVYNGNAVLDAKGEAWVELPAWVETLNRDFRYQLTAIGGPGPNLHIADKVKGNRFRIAGGTPGLEVSWQVTGIRQDGYAKLHPIVVEEDKPAAERGTYLCPEAFAGKR